MPQTFNFPYHQVQIEYPESSARVRFGRGYQYASKPVGPDQLMFRLTFPAMFYIQNSAGMFDSTIQPTINMKTLQDFYEAHLLYEKFYYNHPLKGQVTCRFDKPLVTPKNIPGMVAVTTTGVRRHQLEPFDITLISQP